MAEEEKEDEKRSSETTGTCAANEWLPYGWLVVAASFTATLLADGAVLTFGILYTELLQYFESSAASTSWVGSVLLGVPLLLSPVASVCMDKLGSRTLLVAGGCLSSAGYLLSYFGNSLPVLSLTMGFTTGLGFALVYVPATTIIGYYFVENQALAFAIASSGTGLGTTLFSILIEQCLELYSWRGTCLILTGLCMNLIPCALILKEPKIPLSANKDLGEGESFESLSNLPMRARSRSTGESTVLKPLVVDRDISRSVGHLAVSEQRSAHGSQFLGVNSAVARILSKSNVGSQYSVHSNQCDQLTTNQSHSLRTSRDSSQHLDEENNVDISDDGGKSWRREFLNMFSGMKRVLLSYEFVYFLVSNCLLYSVYHVPYYYIADHAQTRVEASAVHAAALIAILGLASFIGQIAVGWMADRTWCNTEILYLCCICCCAVVSGIVPILRTYASLAVYVCIYGVGLSCNYALGPVLLVDYSGVENLSYSFGILLSVQGFFSLFGPPFMGYLYDITASYDVTFIVNSAACFVSAVTWYLALCIKRSRQRKR